MAPEASAAKIAGHRRTRGLEMPKPILVGYDPSSADRAPIQFGIAAARFTGAPLIIGSAYTDSVIVGQMGHGQMHEDLGGEASDALSHVRIELSRYHHFRAECVGLPGSSASSALHRAAEERGAGLLVVGSRPGGPAGLLRPGSTGERLMHGAPCPLAIVPSGWQAGGGLHTLGVAYTDTPEAHDALHGALVLARRAGVKLRVLTAVKPHAYGKVAGSGPGTEGTSFDASAADSQRALGQILDEAAADAGGVDVETDISVQDAADFLVAASANVDLLVCGSRGYGPKRAVLLGGVSRRVATESSCPVIVLARGIDFGLEALVGEEEHATA
jgi:nucleotide-binding universal stress UspA family protein